MFERNLLSTDFQSTFGKEEVEDCMELVTGDNIEAALDQIGNNSGQIIVFILFLLFRMALFLS